MAEPERTLEGMLKSVGFSSSGIDRIKLGSGVVGKITSTQMGLFVVCFVGVIGATWLQSTLMMLCFGGAAFLSFLFSAIASMWYATRYPSVALLEGAQLLKYRQMEMAARDLQIPTSQPNVEPPQLPPPQDGGEGN